MKTLISYVIAATLFSVCAPSAAAREAVTLQFFYDNLADQGVWREVGDYGYCWQPDGVDSDWRPYSDGRWVYTDAGWTWDSDEPYGWAVYHYGRWVNVEPIGWVWVPGTEWGPGWVSWRHSPRYVGWAPLPPEAQFLAVVGFSAWVDDYYDIGPGSYCFVESRHFGAHHHHSHFIDRRENTAIILETTNITNVTYENHVIHNGGLRFEDMQRQSTSPIHRYSLDRREDFNGDPRHPFPEHLRSRIEGDSLSVFAPSIAGHSASDPRKHSEKIDQARINRGWNNAGSPDDIAAMRSKMKSQTKVPDELPPRPRVERAGEPQPTDSKRINDHPPTPLEKSGNDKPHPPGTPPDPKRLPSEPETKPHKIEPPLHPGEGPDKMKNPQRPHEDGTPPKPDFKPQTKRPEPMPQHPNPPPKPPSREQPQPSKGKPDEKQKKKTEGVQQ